MIITDIEDGEVYVTYHTTDTKDAPLSEKATGDSIVVVHINDENNNVPSYYY